MKKNLSTIAVILTTLVVTGYTVLTVDNSLTPSEKKAGWKLLFDGRSMEGWRAYQNKETNSWTVDKGILYCKGSETDKRTARIVMRSF